MSSTTKTSDRDRTAKNADVETYRLPRWDSQGNLIPDATQTATSEPEDVEDNDIQLPTAEEVRQIHEDAYNEGFESGYEQGMRQGQADGHKQGHQEGFQEGERQGREAGEKAGIEAARATEDARIDAELEPLSALLDSMTSAVPEQEQALKEGLVVLATRIARNVIDADLALIPDRIASLAHAAVQALPNADERLVLEMNPEDEALVARVAESHWTIEPNDEITRGGCIVRTRFSYVDYTLEHRYRQQVSNLLAHLGLSERLTELEQPWPLPTAEAPVETGQSLEAEQAAKSTTDESEADTPDVDSNERSETNEAPNPEAETSDADADDTGFDDAEYEFDEIPPDGSDGPPMSTGSDESATAQDSPDDRAEVESDAPEAPEAVDSEHSDPTSPSSSQADGETPDEPSG